MHEPAVEALLGGSPAADFPIGPPERAAAVEAPQPLGRDWARWRLAINACVATRAALLALFLGTGWFFASSLGFGFIWDDPSWFGRIVGKSLAEIIAPSPDFHFYRPGTMLYIRLFLRADGTFAAPALHWLQACWHLLNLALAFAIGRRIGLGRGAAVALVMLVALYPFSYQAVAWAAPQQPLAMTLQQGAWLAYLFVRRRQPAEKRWPALLASLFLFVLALTVQEVTLPMALMPLLLEIAFSWRRRRPAGGSQRIPLSLASGWHLALIYPLIAALFGVFWLQAPRQPGITGWHFDGQVGRYLLQGIVYPILARPAGHPPNHAQADGPFFAGALATLALCLGLALWRGRAHWAFLGLGWALLGVAPTAVGLPYDYVSLAPRLLYYAAPGVALVWVIAWWPSRPAGGVFRWRHASGVLLLALVAVQSSLLLADFEDLYRRGADHLNELLGQVGDDDRRYLFVNFPDRYAPKRPPFPFGYWGVTLAPVSVDLADFPAAITGARLQTTSVSLPWIDGEARTAGPDQIDLRGAITPPDELYEMAAGYDAVYISHSRQDGRYALRPAGALLAETRAGCRLALYGEAVCLHDVEVVEESDVIRFRLVWSAWSALDPHWTIFAHLGEPDRPPLAQADGDSWEGALPLALWRPGDLIVDERTIARPARGEGPFLIIGVYDWVTGERLPVTDPDGKRLPGYGYVLALRANS